MPLAPRPAGEECYVALDKGAITDQHVLVLPVEHYASSLAAPASTTEEMARWGEAGGERGGEAGAADGRGAAWRVCAQSWLCVPQPFIFLCTTSLGAASASAGRQGSTSCLVACRYLSALRSCFAANGKELVGFERYMKLRKSGGNHCHLNAIAVPGANPPPGGLQTRVARQPHPTPSFTLKLDAFVKVFGQQWDCLHARSLPETKPRCRLASPAARRRCGQAGACRL